MDRVLLTNWRDGVDDKTAVQALNIRSHTLSTTSQNNILRANAQGILESSNALTTLETTVAGHTTSIASNTAAITANTTTINDRINTIVLVENRNATSGALGFSVGNNSTLTYYKGFNYYTGTTTNFRMRRNVVDAGSGIATIHWAAWDGVTQRNPSDTGPITDAQRTAFAAGLTYFLNINLTN